MAFDITAIFINFMNFVTLSGNGSTGLGQSLHVLSSKYICQSADTYLNKT